MNHKMLFLLLFCLSMLFSACSPQKIEPTDQTGMPNPASVFCEENGGVLELRSNASGAVQGVCVFPDGSECDEWAYFRDECQPGNSLDVQEQPIETAEPEVVTEAVPEEEPEEVPEGWKLYRNGQLGYTFQFPADADLDMQENMPDGLTIVGSLKDGDNWPMIYVNHPVDNAAYHPTADVDLAKWLKDHYLLIEKPLEDRIIGGVSAVHSLKARSEQSYAHDSYFFVKDGQLYNIIILHTGDKEDWELYNQFLESFKFD
jgi:putative hemolysin